MKKLSILGLLAIMASSCSDNASTDGNVTLKASAVSTTNMTSARMASTVIITDFKINIGNIKLETDVEDDRFDTDSLHDDVKLVGPFLLDILDPNKALSQIITTVNVPNAQYEEIKFKFEKSIQPGEMEGKTFLIKGTIDGKNFVVWSGKDAELEMDFADPTKDFTVNSNDVTLNIKIQLDALIAKLTSLASQNLLLDTDGDGVIEISTDNDDGHHDFGEQIKSLLEQETDLDDKD
ncbi:hypothetical protein BC952_2608 [Flavobacterium limicola]|uniref:DUF4382 domain-containing protein n=1 Tax=Flavobacterium limicola TaxID=180441 RepID=A0A495S033_9FLAO|nr:hypothetical protein [Flavobacterium limicola]RKS92694.1 hypothetical protein BC952_2608 [Flavobacterium limicola]